METQGTNDQENQQAPAQDATVEPVAVAVEDRVVAEPAPVAQVDNTAKVEDLRPRISGTVTLERPCKDPIKEPGKIPVFILRNTVEEFNEKAEEYPQFNPSTGQEGRDWMVAVREAIPHVLIGGAHMRALARDQADWQQSVESEGVRLLIGRPTMGNVEGQKLTGDRAVMRVQNALGLGSMVQVPLWHSGIWVTIKAPSDSDLLVLERQITEEKITLGRQTNGLIYSNSSVYTVHHLMNFAMQHIYDATIKDVTPDNLKKVIKLTDIPTLVWALACTIYPNGFTFRQPCIDHPDKCQHVTEEHLNLTKLSWVDRSGLTRNQKRHMYDRTAKYTNEEVLKYQLEGSVADGRKVELNDKLAIHLKVPSVEQYIRSGFAWIEGIVESVEKSMGTTVMGREKNRFITQNGIVTALRQYAHWVDKIVFEDNEVVDDLETIEELLSTLSADEKIYEKFFTAVRDYIDDATISMIAIPSYSCPACGKPMSPEESKHPYLIPLEVIRLFFTLTGLKLIRARIAEMS